MGGESTQTNVYTGAALGAAAGTLVLYVAETVARTDFPIPVDGALVVIVTFLVGLAVPRTAGP